MDRYNNTRVLLKKDVDPLSNNYTGELVGIYTSFKFFAEIDHLRDRNTLLHGLSSSHSNSQMQTIKIKITIEISS